MQPGAWRGARLSHEGDEPPFIGGRQVDGDAVDRERDSRVADGRAYSVVALKHRRVREADATQGRGSTTALAICLKYRA